ncbi:helix-turn-helix transcriptional regulator [Leptolyngbya sp. FACHB-261]|nr:helix-turn-helix transcriptional regulator [Leptolyngbya sp. FACHB-261]
MTGLTQEQFGLQVGVSYETISQWENGRMQPS